VVAFAKKLESVVVDIIEGGVMTKDLAAIAEPKPATFARTEEFIDAVAKKL
jgi:isocitrate dehydrogenase